MKDQRPDRDAQRLRSLLSSAAPPGAEHPGRAQRVAARGRRDRRRRGIGAGAVVVAVAALIITPQFLNSSRTTDLRNGVANGPTSSSTDSPTGVDPLATTPCPDKPIAIPDGINPTAIDGPAIRTDAESIRLCAGDIDGGDGPDWLPPADALLLGTASGFFDDTDGLKANDPHRCDAVRVTPDPYVFLVGYPDGSTERAYVASSCDDVTVDDVPHASGPVLDAFMASLDEQRKQLEPGPVETPEIMCLQSGVRTLSFQPTRAPRVSAETRFVAFVPSCEGTESTEKLNDAWPSSTIDLATGEPERVDLCPNADVIFEDGYGVTTWGDVVVFEFNGCGNFMVGGYSPEPVMSGGHQNDVQFLPDDQLSEELGLPHA